MPLNRPVVNRAAGWPSGSHSLVTEILRAAVLTMVGGSIAVGGVLCVRMGLGAFKTPLASSVSLGIWCLAILAIGTARIALRFWPISSRSTRIAVGPAASLSLILLGSILALGTSHWSIAAVIGIIFIIGEFLWYQDTAFPRIKLTPWRRQIADENSSRDATSELISPVEMKDEPLEEGPILANQVDQQWTRQRTEDGRITIHGMLRARLEKGQRIEPLHLAFCPPFSNDPEFTVHLMDGDAIEFRVTEVACYGARVELRRYASAAGQACDAVLYFEAVAKSGDE